MQVHRQHPVCAGGLEEVGNKTGRDGDARLVLLVGPRVGKIGHDGRHAAGGGTLERVDEDEQLHKVLVDGRTARLDDEDVCLAHILMNLHHEVFVRETDDLRPPQRDTKLRADARCELWMGSSRKHQRVVPHWPPLLWSVRALKWSLRCDASSLIWGQEHLLGERAGARMPPPAGGGPAVSATACHGQDRGSRGYSGGRGSRCGEGPTQ